MSWNTYVENLENTNNVAKAAICGQDGSTWACSQGWNISPQEAQTLAAAFKDSSVLVEKGMFVGGERFVYLSGDDEVLRGRKGQTGLHVSKTKSAIIIGFYQDPTQPSQCAKEVDNVAEYLKSQNL
ncbi:hypothetical protein CGJ15_25785 [Vibrio parahaemolyticus]|uniref:Profilin n=1 Tax=Cherax quadricarinatus TaxID=27406 RepID=A0A7U3NU13_CHEQU|nr:profilin [Cherax quadricarinatus]TOF85675.1 hypothetical protein CGJ15_25785 [Vibrio parahaemolyticus]